VLFVVAFAIVAARAVWLQGIRADALAGLAATQHHETITIPAGRGTIFDRLGVQLAIGEEATTVYADPRLVKNPRLIAAAAAKTFGVSAKALSPQLADKKRSFVYIARKADPALAARFLKRHLAGVQSYPEERRIYPQKSVAAQVLGYAGVDNKGLAGLEVGLDGRLAGRPGTETVVKDPLGRPLDVIDSVPERQGRDVFLALDHTIQAQAESVLRATVAHWHAKSAPSPTRTSPARRSSS
jgi:cell division protein FtsI (penicillin-binding protein 3)